MKIEIFKRHVVFYYHLVQETHIKNVQTTSTGPSMLSKF